MSLKSLIVYTMSQQSLIIQSEAHGTLCNLRWVQHRNCCRF